MKLNIVLNRVLLVLGFLMPGLVFLTSCEDQAPMDYIPETYVEAYIYVGHPFEGLKLYKTQPLDKPFDLESSYIKNAEFRIILDGGAVYELQWRDEEPRGYYYPDTAVKVLPNTRYYLEVRLADGTLITGETYTPTPFEWIKAPYDVAYFPVDTLGLKSHDSLRISWTSDPVYPLYFIVVKCLDTLEYGLYLEPPNPDEKNRRLYSLFRDRDNWYREMSTHNLIANNSTSTVWAAFKWFGNHDIIVLRPDYNLLVWFAQAWRMDGSNYNPQLGSVEGGVGVFGSAARISKEMFLMKNQP